MLEFLKKLCGGSDGKCCCKDKDIKEADCAKNSEDCKYKECDNENCKKEEKIEEKAE